MNSNWNFFIEQKEKVKYLFGNTIPDKQEEDVIKLTGEEAVETDNKKRRELKSAIKLIKSDIEFQQFLL